MLLAIIINALLLTGFLFWCKYHFFQLPEKNHVLKKWQEVTLIIMISLVFISAIMIVNQSMVEEKSVALASHDESTPLKIEKEVPQNDQSYAEPRTSFSVDVIPAGYLKMNLNDIAGMHQAKEEVKTLLSFIKSPEKFNKMGAKAPKGLILYGLPGTGKTLLARAIAGEANVTFISTSGAAFEEAYVGRGAARVRELFKVARKYKPAIIFIDEIDSLAPSRSTKEIHQSQIQTVNQLLSEIENLDDERNSGIFLLGATNRLETMDAALLRPGRFDWQIHIQLPTDSDRAEILAALFKKIKLSSKVKIDDLVVKTAGFSGAELTNLVNEAAIFAVTRDQNTVDEECFALALSKIATYEKDLSPAFSLKILSPNEIKTNLSDVAGMNEAKKEVVEIIDFLKDPAKFSRLGAKPPRGVLIYGPPGTGKTMMARAIAGEANASFIAVSGADFDERYVGVGASRVRELFKTARKYKPCIVFIDEIDALASRRGDDTNSGKDQTLNQFLSEMDNIQSQLNEGIIFIGATNRLDILDPAILRPGRFDRKVYFRVPNLEERESILKKYIDKIKAAKNVDIKILARTTVGFSGADIENLVNEAAIEATRQNKDAVDMASFEEANDKITLGTRQVTASYNQTEKLRTAYHEAGHALVGLLHPDNPRTLHKMTIGLRGETLGVTHFRLESDEYSYTKKQLEAMICTSLGGYIAEELIYGIENVSAGASSDLIKANGIAREMVTRLAMSDKQTLIVNDIFPNESEAENNAEEILKRDFAQAKDILQKNMDKLHILAKALVEKETLNYEEIIKLLNINPKKR